MNKRLDRLEQILKQKKTGTNEAYLKAIQRETDRVREHIEATLKAIDGDTERPVMKHCERRPELHKSL